MMKKIFLSAIFPLLSITCCLATSTPSGWTDDLSAAKKQAIKENKILLVNFTGTDWCRWCKVLEKEVLSQKSFNENAKKNFVLVFIDVPNDLTRLSPLGKQQNKKIVDLYKIKSFPTVALMDPSGVILDRAGYQAGGPDKYISMLNAKLTAQEGNIQKLRKIHQAKGVDKAKQIDAWLSNKSIDEKKIAIEWVNEILEIDANGTLGFKKKYTYFTNFVPLEEAVQQFTKEFFAARKNFMASIPVDKKKDQEFLKTAADKFEKEWAPKFSEIRRKISVTRQKMGESADPKAFDTITSRIDLLEGKPSK